MATAQSIISDQDHTDLVHRYCPGLTAHLPRQIAHYIPADPTQCWEWQGSQDAGGYGVVRTVPTPYGFARPVHVHRYMYDCLVGEVNPRNDVHHRCHHACCWNPFHLEEVTPKEHYARHHEPPQTTEPWRPAEQLWLFKLN